MAILMQSAYYNDYSIIMILYPENVMLTLKKTFVGKNKHKLTRKRYKRLCLHVVARVLKDHQK